MDEHSHVSLSACFWRMRCDQPIHAPPTTAQAALATMLLLLWWTVLKLAAETDSSFSRLILVRHLVRAMGQQIERLHKRIFLHMQI